VEPGLLTNVLICKLKVIYENIVFILIKIKITMINSHAKGIHLTSKQKITVISFDETYVSHRICYHKKYEKVYGPHKYVQTVVARGKIF